LILILTWLEIFSLEESNTFFERDFFNLEKEFLVLWSGFLSFESGFSLLWSGSPFLRAGSHFIGVVRSLLGEDLHYSDATSPSY